MDYTTIQPNYELRACSRQQLKGVWNSMALAFFVYFLILIPYEISYFFDIREMLEDFLDGSFMYYNAYDPYYNYGKLSPITNILMLAVLLVSGAFALGFAGYFLKRIRGEEIALKNIFDGFKRFGSSLLLYFLFLLFSFLWSLLLVIPGIIKMFSYSMSFYIFYDYPGISALDALKKSQIMMKGYKFKLFLLELSFIGWVFLGILPLGIGLFWVYPYMSLSMANFYENLKKSQEKVLLKDKPGETAEEEKIEIARKMKNRGRPLDEIVEDTGLSLDIVENL
jgi:uncharacterized membrane protein